ncbi:reverse transcriptase domain-containing protein [Tanacetum coccineum]
MKGLDCYDVTPSDTYSDQAPSGGVTDLYHSQGYREPECGITALSGYSFGNIPTVIPSTSMVPPETSTIAPIISFAAPVVETTLVASPTGLCGLDPYSGSDSDSPDEDPYVATVVHWKSRVTTHPSSSFEFPITPVTAPPGIHRRSAILIRPYEAIPFGRPYRTHLNWPQSSSGDSSERPFHSSSPSAGPSRLFIYIVIYSFWQSTMTNTRIGMTSAAIEEMINQRVDAALEARRLDHDLNLKNGMEMVMNGTRKWKQKEATANVDVLKEQMVWLVLIRWNEKMETVFHISNCLDRYQVKELLKLMTEVYYPRNEIQKMEAKLSNLSVKNNDMATYTQRFQELTMMCTKMIPEEEDWVEKFIRGLPDNIQGNVIAAEPTRLQEFFELPTS